ncbi:MAG: glucosaminidase domain-containing protein [Pseudohongiellaceae bacterium]
MELSRVQELAMAAVTAVGIFVLTLLVAINGPADRTEVPAMEPISVFPDFANIPDIDVKKQQFFDFLEDYIVAENEVIAATREQLRPYVDIVNSGVALSPRERRWILELAEQYRVDTEELSDHGIVTVLWRRVDVVPVSLALAQAANESAWGTSRFTLEGNNLFGQWCYEEGCGIVPARRRQGATHEVKAFESVTSGVQAYLRNINSNPSYQDLRELREDMRYRDEPLNSLRLATGLSRYSQRRSAYVDEVQNIILQNKLQDRDV